MKVKELKAVLASADDEADVIVTKHTTVAGGGLPSRRVRGSRSDQAAIGEGQHLLRRVEPHAIRVGAMKRIVIGCKIRRMKR
jgi:hypothetical protein